MAQIHPLKSEFGLGGGAYLSGSVNMSFKIDSGSSGNSTVISTAYCYYPIQQSVVNIKMRSAGSNSISGPTPVSGGPVRVGLGTDSRITIAAGVAVFGPITEVTQSSGHAFVWYSILDKDDFS